MRTTAKLLFAATLVVLAPTLAFGQASIAGVVHDTSGAVLPGVTVEASSPALIEKVRSSVTDGTGQYRIENLRPGAYSVTFTLPGFSTVKRDGIELTGTFTATINADLRVGSLEETITVTGETPIVDVQNTTRQRVMERDVVDAIPSQRGDKALAMLIPGVSLGTTIRQDVGGSENFTTSNLTVHGSRTSDQRVMHGGTPLGDASQGGGNTRALTNVAAMQEVVVDVGAADAEHSTGGVRINFVPKDGGNTYAGSAFYSFANEATQGTNFTPELEASLGTPNALKRNWDFNAGVGGPVMRDKLWFFGAYRNLGYEQYPEGIRNNLNANNPNAWTYAPDPNSRPFNHLTQGDRQLRVTWQAAPKVKLAFTGQESQFCGCTESITSLVSPEAAMVQRGQRARTLMADWTIPLTNRLLIDGAFLDRDQRTVRVVPDNADPRMISVIEQSLGNFAYRAVDTTTAARPNLRYGPFVQVWVLRSAASYIAGGHAVRAGFMRRSLVETQWYGNVQPGAQQLTYRFNNGVPNQITLFAYPIKFVFDINADHGAFIQDRWTVGRLTASFGVRWDYYANRFPEQTLDPTPLLPNRNFTLAAADGVSWHDMSPKTGAAYDLFGDGKTALKVSMSRYVEGMGTDGLFGSGFQPAQRLSNVTTRSWADSDRDFVPDCDLAASEANGECGAMANQNFGKAVGGADYDSAILSGWGLRPYNWEFSAGFQQQVMPRVSVDVSYYQRWFGNFYVTDNRAVAPSDFTAFSVTAPAGDSRLPTAGQTVGGFYNLNPNRVGQVSDFVTSAAGYGDQSEGWAGIDLTINARFQNGLRLQGGSSSGRSSSNTCEIRAALPETAPTNPFCDTTTPLLTQIKFLGSYIIPKIDVQVSGTLQSIPGPVANANYVAVNAVVQPSLGRALSGGAANVTVPLVEPNSVYADRVNQLDLRVGKILRFGGTKASVNVDLFNALNSNASVQVLNTVGGARPWQAPQSVILARLLRFSAQFDF